MIPSSPGFKLFQGGSGIAFTSSTLLMRYDLLGVSTEFPQVMTEDYPLHLVSPLCVSSLSLQFPGHSCQTLSSFTLRSHELLFRSLKGMLLQLSEAFSCTASFFLELSYNFQVPYPAPVHISISSTQLHWTVGVFLPCYCSVEIAFSQKAR